MRPRISVSTKRLNSQIQALKLDLAKTMPVELATAARGVHEKIKDNLSGTEEQWGKHARKHPSGIAGKLPVRSITGHLKSAQKIKPEGKWIWRLFSDPNVADYGKFVEYGTFKMIARPFHHAAIENARRNLQRRWSLLIESKIMRHGRR